MKTFAKFEATKSSIDRKLDAISQSSKKSQQSSLKKILTAVKSSGKNFRKRVTRYQFSFSCPNFFFYRSSGRTILWKLHVQFILLKGVHLFMTFFCGTSQQCHACHQPSKKNHAEVVTFCTFLYVMAFT